MGAEKLTLIERPCLDFPRAFRGDTILAASSLLLESTIVVGMKLRERPDMYVRHYHPKGEERRRELPLRTSHARRWAEFFDKHMRMPASHSHGGEAIIRYVLGMDITTMHDESSWEPLRHVAAGVDGIEQGKGYSILDDHGKPKHLLYGVDDPGLGLCVLDENWPLVVAPGAGLLELYGSEQLNEIITRSPKCSQYRW